MKRARQSSRYRRRSSMSLIAHLVNGLRLGEQPSHIDGNSGAPEGCESIKRSRVGLHNLILLRQFTVSLTLGNLRNLRMEGRFTAGPSPCPSDSIEPFRHPSSSRSSVAKIAPVPWLVTLGETRQLQLAPL